MVRTGLVALAVLAGVAVASDAWAGDAIPSDVLEQPDPHLNQVPRTAAERARILTVVEPTRDFTRPEDYELNMGGAATTRAAVNRDVFSQFSANMPFAHEMDFKLGNGLFRKFWVSSPSSTKASDGLGPLFNARSC